MEKKENKTHKAQQKKEFHYKINLIGLKMSKMKQIHCYKTRKFSSISSRTTERKAALNKITTSH